MINDEGWGRGAMGRALGSRPLPIRERNDVESFNFWLPRRETVDFGSLVPICRWGKCLQSIRQPAINRLESSWEGTLLEIVLNEAGFVKRLMSL